MNTLFRLCSLAVLGPTLFAQSIQAPATVNQLRYFRHLLLILGSPDASPQSVAMREHSLAIQFGLEQQEVAVIDSAAKQYRTFLIQIKNFVAATPADKAGLSTLVSERQQLEATLANQILQSVRPSTADQLRFPGDFIARVTHQ